MNNYIGKRIDVDPCPMIIMFPKDGAAKEYNDEKFIPMVEVTPRLAEKIPVHKKRDRDNRWHFKSFPGGFVKFVGSNSPSSVKSTPAPVVMIEEPDDCNDNVKEQGDTITLLMERTKSYPRPKRIRGGTPTIEGVSRIAEDYKKSDQRKFFVPCHHCGEAHALSFDYLRWQDDESFRHEVFGHARPETAYYVCPHCGGMWNDAEKNRNVSRAESAGFGWKATAPFYGMAGFFINELYSPFHGSKLQQLVEKLLAAEHALANGDDSKIRAFVNSSKGLPYAYKSDIPKAEHLKERALSYAALTVPHGGLLLTLGADVQHDRLAIIIRAWGRGEESWLVLWDEIYGNTLDKSDPVWTELDRYLFGEYQHASGVALRISAASIDSGDGNTSDAVYDYVRTRLKLGAQIFPTKGDNVPTSSREIFTPPRPIDTNRANTKAAKYGLRVYMVGVNRAKDLILENRLKLLGNGPGRMHWYAEVRADYLEQLTSEVKAPSRTSRGKKVWQKKAGARNEALDAEIEALHAARSLKTHVMSEAHWSALEVRLKQLPMFPLPIAHDDDESEEISQNEIQETPRPVFGSVPTVQPEEPRKEQHAGKVNKFTGRSGGWLRR